MAESGKMSRALYLSLYDSLPNKAKKAMSELWDTGVNNSGVWVRYGDVESTVGKIVMSIMRGEQKPLKYTGESICLYCETLNCDGCMYEPMKGATK